jgi:hypothetical protein
MDAQRHWENIYSKKAADAVSWYRPHLETSLEFIERAASEYSASIIDIGGGESTLVDDLLARGYRNISVLDIWRLPSMRTKSGWGLPWNESIGSSLTSRR